MNKSLTMSMYNKARAAARQGKLDPQRTNRAFGIVQTADGGKATFEKYNTTTKSCNCPDHKRTGQPCKHMIAHMIQVRISQQEKPQVEQMVSKVYTAANGDVLMAEQKVGRYQIHVFRSENHFNEFSVSHKSVNFVRPMSVTGRRVRPDIDHTQEF